RSAAAECPDGARLRRILHHAAGDAPAGRQPAARSDSAADGAAPGLSDSAGAGGEGACGQRGRPLLVVFPQGGGGGAAGRPSLPERPQTLSESLCREVSDRGGGGARPGSLRRRHAGGPMAQSGPFAPMVTRMIEPLMTVVLGII